MADARALVDAGALYGYGSVGPTAPTWREWLAQQLMGDHPGAARRRLVGGILGSTGLGGSEQLGLADLTPAAVPLSLQEAAQRDVEGTPGWGAKLAAIPVVGKEAQLGFNAARQAARAATFDVAGREAALAAPAIHTGGEASPAMIEQIQRAAVAHGDKPLPTATQPVFDVSPEALQRTYDIVPQRSIRDVLPSPMPGEKLPLGARVQPVIERTPELSTAIAARLRPLVEVGDRHMQFYGTGPIIEGLEEKAGLSQPQAVQFMRDWSGFGSATSPQSETPRNLKNASFLNYLYGQGRPMPTKAEGWTPAMNTPGYPMMGMHVDLAREFAEGRVDPWKNPKPAAFREAWSGNVADVVADTHNIRATLLELDRLYPGAIPRGYFSPRGWEAYQQGGLQANLGTGNKSQPLLTAPDDFIVAPHDTSLSGRRRRAEFGAVAEPWIGAAEQLGIRPGQAQSLGWFEYGGQTGLGSPPKLIPDLLNDQIEATAKATGQSPEAILKLWGQRRIPLSEIAATSRLG